MQTKWIVGIIIILIVAVWLGRGTGNENQSGEPVKIGAVLHLTEWGAYWGEPEQDGALLAVEDIEAQGGDVELIVEDGATTPQKSASAAQKLINVDGVHGLFVDFTGPASAVSPISRSNEVPMLFVSATRIILDENPYSFKMYFDVEEQCNTGAEYLADQGVQRIGGFLMNLDFAEECRRGIEEAISDEETSASYYEFNIDTTDFRTLITKAKSDGVDAVLPIFYEENAIAFFQQRRELDFITPVFTALGRTDGFPEEVENAVPAESLEGVITYDQRLTDEFVKSISSKHPELEEDQFLAAAYGYDQLTFLYNAIKECDRGDTECILDQIKSAPGGRALVSDGFGEDRNIILEPFYLLFTGGELTPLNL